MPIEQPEDERHHQHHPGEDECKNGCDELLGLCAGGGEIQLTPHGRARDLLAHDHVVRGDAHRRTARAGVPTPVHDPRALARAGIKVPEQCSIIGFDDVAPAAFSTPALTTIRQPMEAMGTTAVQLVIDSIRAAVERREANVSHRKVAPELVIRESTKPLG